MGRQRREKNKDVRAGLKNRSKGLSKKAHTYARLYGSDILLVIRRPDGRYCGYESRMGLSNELLRSSPGLDNELLRPEDFPNSDLALPELRKEPSQPESVEASSPSERVSSASESASIISTMSEADTLVSAHESPYIATEEIPVSLSPPVISPFRAWDLADGENLAHWERDYLHLQDDVLMQNFVEVDDIVAQQPPEENGHDSEICQPDPVSSRQKKAMMLLLDKYF